MEMTASDATSKQMLHSKAESFLSLSSSPVVAAVGSDGFDFSFSIIELSLLRAPVSNVGVSVSTIDSSSSAESSIVPSSKIKHSINLKCRFGRLVKDIFNL